MALCGVINTMHTVLFMSLFCTSSISKMNIIHRILYTSFNCPNKHKLMREREKQKRKKKPAKQNNFFYYITLRDRKACQIMFPLLHYRFIFISLHLLHRNAFIDLILSFYVPPVFFCSCSAEMLSYILILSFFM